MEGGFQRLYKDNYQESFIIVPACIASKDQHYITTKTTHTFQSLQEEFTLGEEVLVTHWNQDLCGAKGKVVGYDNNKVKVEIIEHPKYKEDKVKEII